MASNWTVYYKFMYSATKLKMFWQNLRNIIIIFQRNIEWVVQEPNYGKIYINARNAGKPLMNCLDNFSHYLSICIRWMTLHIMHIKSLNNVYE